VTRDDELGQFKRNFNNMVDKLHRAQAALEDRVREKTEQLVRSNRQLELLYKAVRQLSGQDFGHDTVHQVLVDLREALDATAVCLRGVAGDARLAQPAGRDDAGAGSPTALHLGSTGSCSHTDCGDCPMRSSANFFHGDRAAAEGRLIVTPLTQGGAVHSYLTVKLRKEPEPWQIALTRAVRRHIEVALDHAQRVEGRRRAAVDEERASIARELHDSLAQALTYVNVQIARLDRIDAVRQDAGAADIVREIRAGVADAYRQLRELITAFRARVENRSFRLGIEDTVRDCRRRLGIDIQVDDRSGTADLSADEQIQVLHIIREALANAAHHAQASAVRLALGDDPARGLRVRVEDDGRGLHAPVGASEGHHGIAIMRERAARLGGQLDIGTREGGGTRVELSFVPTGRRT
jgi:two-component system nitrate/nitrite sensor histidine kinase NarX